MIRRFLHKTAKPVLLHARLHHGLGRFAFVLAAGFILVEAPAIGQGLTRSSANGIVDAPNGPAISTTSSGRAKSSNSPSLLDVGVNGTEKGGKKNNSAMPAGSRRSNDGAMPAGSRRSNDGAMPAGSRRSNDSSGSNSGSSPIKLYASVTHSERLAPSPLPLRVGGTLGPSNSFTVSKFNPLKFRIPDWLCGIWMRDQCEETDRVQLPSGKHLTPAGKSMVTSKDVFGSYRDKTGQVWQIFTKEKATGVIDRQGIIDTFKVQGYGISQISKQEVAVMVQAIHIAARKADKRIVSIYQDEELNNYKLLRPGVVEADSSVKVFGLDGKPVYLTRSRSIERCLSAGLGDPARLETTQDRENQAFGKAELSKIPKKIQSPRGHSKIH